MKKSSIRGVLFDLDGTLIDSYDLLLTSHRHATRLVLGQKFSDDILMAKVGQPLVTQMWDFTDDPAQHDELVRVYREHNETVHDQMVHPFSGTYEALLALRTAGLPLGVVTSKRHVLAERGLRVCGLQDLIAFTVGSDDWSTYKPDPGPVLHGCNLLGLLPAECLYVGDSPFDLQAGNAAGCLTAAALWGMFPADVLAAENPTFTFKSMADISALI